jgi:iron complex outermembrane receptor protein
MRGFLTGVAGSNNGQAGGSASFTYGARGWRLFGDGGSQRSGSYTAGGVEIANTQSRTNNGQIGFGRDKESGFFSLSGGYDKGLYGIVGEETSIDFRRYNSRFNGGFQNWTGPIRTFRSTVAYTDWKHAEIEDGAAATTLRNRQLTYRGVFEQARSGAVSGSFGFSGVLRHYEAVGEETLAPPTAQKSIAGFVLEEAALRRAKLQWGGRFDHVGYAPDGGVERAFNGFSAGAGFHAALWRSGAFVANYTNSYRAPALEELYNNGPHPGNVAFEVGRDDLGRERSNGIDLSLRHQDSHVHAEANFFYYDIDNFVHLAPTTDIEGDLRVFDYAQGGARFVGAEAVLDVAVHPYVWVDFRIDSVNAKLKATDTPLPRIPPVRGEVGLDILYKGLSLHPEVVAANAQNKTSSFETRTPGYTVFNLKGSYTVVRPHEIHILAVNAFNLGDRVYLNHVSFVKDQGPEIGRGFSVSYSMRFF